MAGAQRDGYVDWFKGLLILWVVHIHTVFWSGKYYIPDFYRQLTLLIDVPVFFFISGYLTRPAPFVKMVIKVVRQLLRLYMHYLIISLLLLGALLIVKPLVFGGSGDVMRAIKTAVVLAPRGDLFDIIRVYNGSLWFIRDYISMLVFVPLLLGIRSVHKISFIVVIFLLLLSTLFPENYPNRVHMFSTYGSVFFYLSFFMFGVLFREHENHLDLGSRVLALVISVFVAFIIFDFDDGRLSMQAYKFPPSTQYMIYSLMLVFVFIFLKKVLSGSFLLTKPFGAPFFEWCGRNVFTIYLMQGAACSVPYFFLRPLIDTYSTLTVYCIVLVFNLLFTLLLTYLYSLGQKCSQKIIGPIFKREKPADT